MFDPERKDRLAQLGAHAAGPAAFSPLDEQLGDLLADGRSTFDDAAVREIAAGRARQRDWIDADVRVEPAVLRGKGRRNERGREPRWIDRLQPRAVSG